MEKLPIDDMGRPSHLAVRLDLAENPRADDLCVLFAHGFGSRHSGEKALYFRECCLASGLSFCAFDFQGHGESGGGLRELTLSRNLADIGRVHGYLRGRGFRRLVLFGSSMGGASALWYTALHPEDIVAAIHIAPALAMEKSLLDWAGPAGARRWQADGFFPFSSDLVTCELGWELIEDLRTFDLERLEELYKTPALILQGTRDESVPWEAVVDFAAGCQPPGPEVHLFSGGDHRLVDRLPYLWSLVRTFLEAQHLA